VEKFINTDRYTPMSTKLQTALCTMTVSMVGKLVFKLKKKTVRCFWRTLYLAVSENNQNSSEDITAFSLPRHLWSFIYSSAI